jgi:hypothetical protein
MHPPSSSSSNTIMVLLQQRVHNRTWQPYSSQQLQ